MKMRITIEVERADGPLTDEDLRNAAERVTAAVELRDVNFGPIGSTPFDVPALHWAYVVEEVKP
jgi:hypothetical protein